MAALANGINRCLAAKHQGHKDQGPQSVDIEIQSKFSAGWGTDAEGQEAKTHDGSRQRQAADAPHVRSRRCPDVVCRQ